MAEATFSVIPPRQVIAGNRFAVTFRLQNGEGSSLNAPQINGCTLLYGPSTSTMQSYQIVNGQATSSSSIDYTYTYRADKAGTFTIGSASIVVGGKTLRSREAKFTVLPADHQSSNAQQGGRPQVSVDDYSTQTPDRNVGADDVFVRIILSKSQAYEQEAIECTIKLYTKYQISSFMPTTQPNFEGFLIDEANVQPALNEMEHYKGQNYMTAILKKCVIFPQKSGKLTINSGRYDLTVVQYERVNMGFFGSTRPVEKKIQVNSNSCSVNITPLPQPAPDGFNGAVGHFTIDSKLNGSSFRTNEAASLTYTISGTGNIKYLKEPSIDFPSEFEQFTPKTDISSHVSGTNVTGSMTVEYTFVPQSVGKFTIGSDKFVYFNPATKQYVTLTTPSYDLDVAKGAGSSSTTVDKEDVKIKNADIIHIKLGDKGLSHDHTLIIDRWWYWAIYIALAAILAAAIAFAAKRIRLNADVTGQRLAKANKMARRRLKAAAAFMKARESEKFYDETLRAVWGYLSDKLSMPSSQLSRENIASELSRYGADQQLTDRFIEVLDQCEMARYTPQLSDNQLENIYNAASSAISDMASIKRAKQPTPHSSKI
jgi:hypothetical protein